MKYLGTLVSLQKYLKMKIKRYPVCANHLDFQSAPQKLIERYQISHHSFNFCINAIEMFNTGNWLGFVDLLVNMKIQLTLKG